MSLMIRRYVQGEEQALRKVFFSSVHLLAKDHYNLDQLHAWAPEIYDIEDWRRRIESIKPFVAIISGKIVGYADLQSSGYIDHFFVSGHFGRKGAGGSLMRHILATATSLALPKLHADVSLSAEAFFRKHGFSVEERKLVSIRGQMLRNARMVKCLA